MKQAGGAALRSLLPGARSLRNVAVLVAGTAGGQAVVLLSSPLLTRLYTPADFGYLAVFMAMMALVVVIGSMRFEVAVPLAADDVEASNVLALSVSIVVVMAAVAALVLGWWSNPLLALLHAQALGPYLWLLPISILGAGIYQALSYWAIRKETYRPIGATTATRGLAQVLAQIGLGLAHAGSVGLIAGDAFGRVVGNGPLARFAARGDLGAHGVSLRSMARSARRYWRFPAFSAPSALLSTASQQIPSLLFVAFYDVQVAGWISVAQRVVGVPAALLGKAVSQVYFGEASKLMREDPRKLSGLFLTTGMRMAILAAVPAAILVVAGPFLFAHVFGESWTMAGKFVRLLAPMFLVQFAVYPVSETLNIMERQRLRLVWDVVRLMLLAAALWSAKSFSWSASNAVLAYGTVMVATYSLLFMLSYAAIRRAASIREAHDRVA